MRSIFSHFREYLGSQARTGSRLRTAAGEQQQDIGAMPAPKGLA